MKKDEEYSVSNYLHNVTTKMDSMEQVYDFAKYAFRGEPQIFPTPGLPGIFRGNDYDELIKNPMFERNLLNEMKSNALTTSTDDLLMATDAQHDGFPSRLLDISYNCLIGLFFAVTPHYSKDIDCFDKSDGQVIIYGIDRLYSAHESGVREEYSRNLSEKKLDGINIYRHKFIDHVTSNKRIIAQDGGFVLFNGQEFNPIPKWQQMNIRIPAVAKKNLREQLRVYFDIDMGTIYPEPANKVQSILKKSKLVHTTSVDSDKSKIKLEISMELQFYKDTLYKISKEANKHLVLGTNLDGDETKIFDCLTNIESYTLKSIHAIKQSAEYDDYIDVFGKYKTEFQKILDAFLNNQDEYKENKWSVLNNLRVEDGEFI